MDRISRQPIVWLLSMLFGFSSAFAQYKEMIAKEAEQYAAALEDGDWEELLKLTNEEIIRTNGGSRTMVAQSEAFEAEMQQRGFYPEKSRTSRTTGGF